MEIFANFKLIKWHWTKTKQKKLEKSLKYIDEYLLSIEELNNKSELLLLTTINSIIDLLDTYNHTSSNARQILQSTFDMLVLDENIKILIGTKLISQMHENIQAIDSDYNDEQIKIEIYRFLQFLTSIFERLINVEILEKNITFSTKKKKITKKQEIIEFFLKNKNINQPQIAKRLNTSLSYVKKVLSKFNNTKSNPKKVS